MRMQQCIEVSEHCKLSIVDQGFEPHRFVANAFDEAQTKKSCPTDPDPTTQRADAPQILHRISVGLVSYSFTRFGFVDRSMYDIHHREADASLACKGEALMALVTANAAATTVPVSMTCIQFETGCLAAFL
jgi:hypothetical protein